MKRAPLTLMLLTTLLSATDASADKGDVLAQMTSPGDSASGLGWDGDTLWVANLMTATGGGSNRVSQHDPVTFEELHAFPMQGSDVFHGLAFDEEGHIWTDNFNKSEILKTDIVKLDLMGNTLEVHPAAGTIYGVARSDDGRLFQVDNHSVEPGGNDMLSDLYVLDATTLEVMSGPTPLAFPAARGVAFDGTALWVASNATDSVHRVDATTGEAIDQFSVPGEGGVEGLAWDGQCLWVSDTRGDVIYRLDHGQPDLPACEPFPPSPPPGEGGGDGSGGDGAGGDAGLGGMGGTVGDPPPAAADSEGTSSASGCAMAPGAPRNAEPWWLLLAAFALSGARAARRGRPSAWRSA